ncbi:hypothetical protein MKW92_038917 [Papaver armeniacum]|nr:hypothetical protein MKW92_038917 [Papaver armeniacum]
MLVDESQRQLKERGDSSRSYQEKSSEGSPSESDHDNERHDAPDADEETEEATTLSLICGISCQQVHLGAVVLSFIDHPLAEMILKIAFITFVGINHPYVRQHKKLPDPVEKEKGVTLWSMIQDNISKDLTRVSLHVYFSEPLASLQTCYEDLNYSFLLGQADAYGKRDNSVLNVDMLRRMEGIARR